VVDQPTPGDPMLNLSEEFMRLFALNQRRIYGYIVTLLPQHADAEEVLQQTNFVLWRRFADFRQDADFAAWAFGVARNEVRRYLRDRGRQVITLDDDLLELLADVHVEQGEMLNAQRTALAFCLDKLTPRDRELMEKCYGGDVSIKRIAEQLDRPLNTVYKAAGRLRRTLYECIQRRLAAEGRS
jgi:RNA polymerase sigma-70 factor (ECF subfamily)